MSNVTSPAATQRQHTPEQPVGGTINVSTGEFRALRDQVTAIEAEVAKLRRSALFTTELADHIEAQGYREGRESVLGRQAGPRPLRTRHLRAVAPDRPSRHT